MNGTVRSTIEIDGEAWRLADPLETQDPETMPVPDETAGVYLLLERSEPGPSGRAADLVPYVGQGSVPSSGGSVG